jgi:hypothetical protein
MPESSNIALAGESRRQFRNSLMQRAFFFSKRDVRSINYWITN